MLFKCYRTHVQYGLRQTQPNKKNYTYSMAYQKSLTAPFLQTPITQYSKKSGPLVSASDIYTCSTMEMGVRSRKNPTLSPFSSRVTELYVYNWLMAHFNSHNQFRFNHKNKEPTSLGASQTSHFSLSPRIAVLLPLGA